MAGLEIEMVPILKDNYVYLLHEPGAGVTAVVDPGDAAPVLSRLAEKRWTLDWILNTHHHPDHTDGNLEVKEKTGCRVAGPAGEKEKIPGIDVTLGEGDRFELGEAEALVLETPGHTSGHISYWFEAEKALFCGDTLFSIGCGRLFEGSAEEMWTSLQKYAALPDDAKVYCGHEYTQANVAFALTVDSRNRALEERAEEVKRLRAEGKPTIPSTLGVERAANPFLRAEDAGLRKELDMETNPPAEVFGELRRRKDEA